MNRTRTYWLVGGVLVMVAVVIAMIVAIGQGHDDELRIGVVFPLTGDAASYGEKGREAIDLAVSIVNAEGGCGGRPVRVIYEDSRADPKTGVSAIRKLISADHVPIVIGDIVSAVTLAAAPIAENNRVVLLSPTSSSPAITNAGHYIYRIWPSDLAEGRAIAKLALSRDYRRVSIFHMNNDYGTSIAQVFKKTFEAGGGSIPVMEAYQAEGTDYRSFLAKMKMDAPDALYIAGYFADTATIVRQLRELGLSTQVLGTTAVEDDKFLQLAGDAAEGVIYPLATGFDPASSDAQVQQFVKKFRSRYGHEPGWVEAQAYDAFMLICHVASRLDEDVTGEALKKALDTMGSYKGVAGVIEFDENGDVVKPVVLKTVRNGVFSRLAGSE
ncbi:MAG TPA: hypothetical protein ENH80_00540 [Phycisphaerae bacterium]|nr:hypothetical protein [Phycisphaerae bacterium]HDZ42409.1 hypothetical protein [Phycisphaerae bacterium]